MTAANEIAALDSRVRSYDLGAWLYDWVVASTLYHRLMWGMHPDQHEAFARRALAQARPGKVLDAGSGSLLFTARAYRQSAHSLTLLDGSLGMLARARRRLGSSARESRIELRQGDLYALPFQTAEFANLFQFGVLHCLERPERSLAELARVAEPGARLFLSCLVLGRKRGDAFLTRLQRAGQIAAPRTADEVSSLLQHAGFRENSRRVQGSFLFVEAVKA
ncbi:MAG TPA: class I SAM-dependent methyltransferase [Polyangiaceae bacterium]